MHSTRNARPVDTTSVASAQPIIARAKADGRRMRRQRTRTSIILACRELMLEGVLRPDSRKLAARCRISSRTLFWHFSTLQAIYREALEDADVVHTVERRVPTDRTEILRAIVLGELPRPTDHG